MEQWLLAFTLGNAAILTNACLLPLYPGLMAFLAGNANNERAREVTALLGVLVLAGILTMMVFIGGILALLSASFGSVLTYLLPIIYAIVIILGVMMLTGRNPFATLQTAQAPMLRNPYITAYVYGLFFGPMTLPCTGPIILSAFTLGSGIGTLASGLSYFFFFGLGFGWPLVLLPVLAMPFQRRIVGWLSRNHDLLNIASGILLIAVGIFGIITELVPQYRAGFYLNPSQQLTYWAVVAIITIVVAAGYHNQQKTSETTV
ncbi:MAG: cytochrome c-type biogenesis protein CcdA [Phototrophicaceae bacterium]